jgi:hypothetical protein
LQAEENNMAQIILKYDDLNVDTIEYFDELWSYLQSKNIHSASFGLIGKSLVTSKNTYIDQLKNL